MNKTFRALSVCILLIPCSPISRSEDEALPHKVTAVWIERENDLDEKCSKSGANFICTTKVLVEGELDLTSKQEDDLHSLPDYVTLSAPSDQVAHYDRRQGDGENPARWIAFDSEACIEGELEVQRGYCLPNAYDKDASDEPQLVPLLKDDQYSEAELISYVHEYDPKVPAPAKLSFGKVSGERKLRISWEHPLPGVGLTFRVGYRTKGSSSWTYVDASVNSGHQNFGNVTTAVFPGYETSNVLNGGATYEFRVRGGKWNDGFTGWGAWSEITEAAL